MPFQNSDDGFYAPDAPFMHHNDFYSSNAPSLSIMGSFDKILSVECDICGKLFSGLNRKFLLTRHRITHTGVKAYRCTICPYSANVSSNLQRHIKSQHRTSLSHTPKWSNLYNYTNVLVSKFGLFWCT